MSERSENLAGILTATAERFGDRTAMKLDDAELTYAQLDEATFTFIPRFACVSSAPFGLPVVPEV